MTKGAVHLDPYTCSRSLKHVCGELTQETLEWSTRHGRPCVICSVHLLCILRYRQPLLQRRYAVGPMYNKSTTTRGRLMAFGLNRTSHCPGMHIASNRECRRSRHDCDRRTDAWRTSQIRHTSTTWLTTVLRQPSLWWVIVASCPSTARCRSPLPTGNGRCAENLNLSRASRVRFPFCSLSAAAAHG